MIKTIGVSGKKLSRLQFFQNPFLNLYFFIFQGRRRSFDLEDISPLLNLENQENDYTKRRNTTDNDNPKIRERNFIKRQIVLGNIEVGETSEDMTLSMISAKHSSEDLSKSINDISETIFKMDSLDMENSKVNYSKHIKMITKYYSVVSFIRLIFKFGNIAVLYIFTFSFFSSG